MSARRARRHVSSRAFWQLAPGTRRKILEREIQKLTPALPQGDVPPPEQLTALNIRATAVRLAWRTMAQLRNHWIKQRARGLGPLAERTRRQRRQQGGPEMAGPGDYQMLAEMADWDIVVDILDEGEVAPDELELLNGDANLKAEIDLVPPGEEEEDSQTVIVQASLKPSRPKTPPKGRKQGNFYVDDDTRWWAIPQDTMLGRPRVGKQPPIKPRPAEVTEAELQEASREISWATATRARFAVSEGGPLLTRDLFYQRRAALTNKEITGS